MRGDRDTMGGQSRRSLCCWRDLERERLEANVLRSLFYQYTCCFDTSKDGAITIMR